MGHTSHDAAIAAALTQNWKEAIRLNSELLKTDKNNLETLNRLGYAYLMLGQLTAAKRTLAQVIKLDPYNQIAQRNTKKLASLRAKDIKEKTGSLSPLTFLEEPGKTKIVECINPAQLQALSNLSPGQEVVLRPRNHVVEIRNDHNVYLGALPDDLSFRLLKFIAGGNRYQAFVKSVGKNSLVVFLREAARGKRFSDQPSFTPSHAYIPYTHEGVGSDERHDISASDEEKDRLDDVVG